MGKIVLKKANSSYSENENFSISVWGYVIPRMNEKNNDILNLLVKYGYKFIKYIKGHFIIEIFDKKKNERHLYTDHIGIKKLYYRQNENDFIISDNIHYIQEIKGSEISPTNLALHSLFHHFIDGRTIYESIHYSKPASHFIISADGILRIENYWSYQELLSLEEKSRTYQEFADTFKSIIKSYLSITSKKVTMTLTGGMDSRIVLDSLLYCNHKPYAFTFGNKNSADVEISKKISAKTGIEYNIYDFPNPDRNWYYKLSSEIANRSNGLVHIHRSHRLDAMKREKAKHSNTDTIFLGAMGGEGIRGLHYDDLITTSFVRKLYETDESQEDLVIEYLEKYFHKPGTFDKEEIIQIIKDQNFIKNDYKTNQFYLLYELVASLHDTQDIELYYNYYDNVITPFLDIDYLELLFSSQFHLLHKNATSHRFLDRLSIPEFHVNVSHLINKDLSSIQYSNGFSPDEYLLGKYPYLLIRGIRKYFKKKYPPNFPYNNWYVEFVKDNLKTIDKEVEELFDVEKATSILKSSYHQSVEGYWHKYSNLIMYSLILNKYNYNK